MSKQYYITLLVLAFATVGVAFGAGRGTAKKAGVPPSTLAKAARAQFAKFTKHGVQQNEAQAKEALKQVEATHASDPGMVQRCKKALKIYFTDPTSIVSINGLPVRGTPITYDAKDMILVWWHSSGTSPHFYSIDEAVSKKLISKAEADNYKRFLVERAAALKAREEAARRELERQARERAEYELLARRARRESSSSTEGSSHHAGRGMGRDESSSSSGSAATSTHAASSSSSGSTSGHAASSHAYHGVSTGTGAASVRRHRHHSHTAHGVPYFGADRGSGAAPASSFRHGSEESSPADEQVRQFVRTFVASSSRHDDNDNSPESSSPPLFGSPQHSPSSLPLRAQDGSFTPFPGAGSSGSRSFPMDMPASSGPEPVAIPHVPAPSAAQLTSGSAASTTTNTANPH